jgi:trans-aconitate methyltransferase
MLTLTHTRTGATLNALATRTGLNAFAWDLRYKLLGRHFGVPSDVLEHVGKPASLLDGACGRAMLLQMLRTNDWSGTYRGFDVSRYVITQARKLDYNNAFFECSSIEDFDHRGQQWDRIVIAEAMYYVDLGEVQNQVSRYRAMLKPDGALLIRMHDFSKFRGHVYEVKKAGGEQVSPQLLRVEASSRARSGENEGG